MQPLYKALLAALSLAASLPTAAQDTTYLSATDMPTSRQLAAYFEVKAHTDSGWTFTDRWMNKRLKITGRISDDMKQRLGTFTYYDTAGVVVMRNKYVGHGGAIETIYYPGGQVMLEGTTLEDQKTGNWTSYYPSGKVKATAFYSGNQIDTASFFNEDGSPNNTMTTFWRESDYPGGDLAWIEFLNKNLQYPPGLVSTGDRAVATVQFKVSKEGKTSGFTIIQSAGSLLDDVAIRIIQKSGDWQPAIYGGTPLETFKTQSIAFTPEGLSQPGSDTADFDKTFTKVEIESEFPGGVTAWLRYLNKTLRYPDEAVNRGIQGTVVVQFIVDKQGHISDVQAISGPATGGLREEAVRVIRNSGIWTPAVQNGRQVNAYKKQPIVFRIER
jgi:TonB family protein